MRARTRRHWASLIAAAAAACAGDAPEPPAAIAAQLPHRIPRAVLSAIVGDVSVKRAEGDAWRAATNAMKLFANDKVRTAPGASAQLRFESGSALTLSEDALIAVAEARPRPGDDPSDVTVFRGRIDAELPHPERQSITVTTPSATVRAGREIVFQ